MRDGKKVEFVATGVIIEKGEILLVHHKKLNLWLPPGGHIEENELPNECVLREVKEETGFEVEVVNGIRNGTRGGAVSLPPPDWMQIEDIQGTHWHLDMLYLCRIKHGTLKKSDESDDVRFFRLDEVNALNDTTDDVRYLAGLLLKR